MSPDPATLPSSPSPAAAEKALLLSADETDRIPFPEGTYRDIAAFLEAMTRLEKAGHLEHRLQNGFLGCYLTESGRRLQSQLRPPADAPRKPEEQSFLHAIAGRVALLLFTVVIGATTATGARLGETPMRPGASHGTALTT
jgi:hypothetical protein